MSYTKAEDLAILGFIADNRRFGDVGGVEMWKLMEEREVVVGRSWQSMKERFRKKIVNNIKSYNLSKEQLKGFTAGGGKEKQENHFLFPPHLRVLSSMYILRYPF